MSITKLFHKIIINVELFSVQTEHAVLKTLDRPHSHTDTLKLKPASYIRLQHLFVVQNEFVCVLSVLHV